jgi:hypothetical protein
LLQQVYECKVAGWKQPVGEKRNLKYKDVPGKQNCVGNTQISGEKLKKSRYRTTIATVA